MECDLDELTDDALTDRVRVWQRRRGHRYSADDVATAFVGLQLGGAARSCLDLGCGIGSVLLMLADRLPLARVFGIEAQVVSFELARQNLLRNSFDARVEVALGDLRDPAVIGTALVGAAGRFELVTGTPPYQPPGTATASPDSQRAHARLELRGGVEDYLCAAASALAPEGVFVMCAQGSLQGRIERGARVARLRAVHRLDVLPATTANARLFSVHSFVPEAAAVPARLAAPLLATGFEGAPGEFPVERVWLRDGSGARTAQERTLRACFGLASDPAERPSPRLRQRPAPRPAIHAYDSARSHS